MIQLVVSRCRRWSFFSLGVVVAIIAALAIAPASLASTRPHKKLTRKAAKTAARPKPKGAIPFYRAALLVDGDTGHVLYEENADLVWPPASMAKMMLLLVAS